MASSDYRQSGKIRFLHTGAINCILTTWRH
jgi:hypothetical protein